jgi:hypothetical protein
MRYFRLTPERYEELRAAVLSAVDEPLSSAEVKDRVRAGDEIRYVLGAMARRGELVRGGARVRAGAGRGLRLVVGVDRKQATAALDAVDTVALDDGMLLRRADREELEPAPRPRGIDVLPKWTRSRWAIRVTAAAASPPTTCSTAATTSAATATR